VESKSVVHSSHQTEQPQRNSQGLLQEAGNQNYSLLQEEQKDMEDRFTVDIQDLPSFDLLSFREQNVRVDRTIRIMTVTCSRFNLKMNLYFQFQLCLNLKIFPSDYLKYKVAILLVSCYELESNLIHQIE
jgi:hypothetical protein